MGPIVINIDPVLLELGHVHVRWYGLIVLLAIVSGVWLGTREAARKGISSDDASGLAAWAVLGGLVGARLFHVVDRLDYYLVNPMAALAVWQGGLAIWGAIAGGAGAAALYALRHRLPLASLADAAAPALLLGQIIGRVACIINGDSAGVPTDLPWGFAYVHPRAMVPPDLVGVPTHPYPLYEILWNGATLALVWALRTRLKVDGALFLTYVTLYALGRFALSFVRREAVWFLGLQEAQVVAVVVLLAAAAAMYLVWRRAQAPVALAEVETQQ